MPDVTSTCHEDEAAEELALELAVKESRSDPRQSIPHALVRLDLLRDVEIARARIAALVAKGRREG
jgi:hypothetical protein